MSSQWRSVILAVGAIVAVVVASIVYQPDAAKTGYLLVWLKQKVYIMDVDTDVIYPIAPAEADTHIAPSPGCLGQAQAPCWVVIGDKIYTIGTPGDPPVSHDLLWPEHVIASSAVSWSPDGQQVAYLVLDTGTRQTELNIYHPVTHEREEIQAVQGDPRVAVAWSQGCIVGSCELAYKTQTVTTTSFLVAYQQTTHLTRQWAISAEAVAELRWSPDSRLFYSHPSRHFYAADTHEPAYALPKGATLANVSPDLAHLVYYQPFTLKDCEVEACLYLGVWLTPYGQTTRQLLYSADLVKPTAGLNYIPTWFGQNMVFFQEGKLVFYEAGKNEAAIWIKSLQGKLRSQPIFAPRGDAVAFIDNQGVNPSQYRLMIINPKLQPVEKVIQAETGFQILAWLPD